MRVKEIMRSEPRICGPDDSAHTAGRLMAEIGAGWLPVVSEGRPVGVVTDRDLCLALAQADRRPSELRVVEAMTPAVHGCRAGDDVREALAAMREHRVRRLAVLDDEGRLAGMLALDDVVLEAQAVPTEGFAGPFYADISNTLRAVVYQPLPAVTR